MNDPLSSILEDTTAIIVGLAKGRVSIGMPEDTHLFMFEWQLRCWTTPVYNSSSWRSLINLLSHSIRASLGFGSFQRSFIGIDVVVVP